MAKKPERRVALAFMAHPDDAEILCAGTMIRLGQLGWELHIATAAPGDCGTATQDRWAISARRVEEARAAAAMIGATYHCIDEKDGFVVYDKTSLQKTYDLFRRIGPGLVFAHAPKDYMLDHEMASLLARAASFIYGAPNCSAFPVPPGSGVPYLYYCDAVEGIDPFGQPIRPTTYIDVAGQMETKLAMLACHASQRDWLMAHHGMDEYLDAARRQVAHRGAEVGLTAAEAFVQHRGHAYPAEDLLAELLGGKAATRV